MNTKETEGSKETEKTDVLFNNTNILWEGIGHDGVDGGWDDVDYTAYEIVSLMKEHKYEDLGKFVYNQVVAYASKYVIKVN